MTGGEMRTIREAVGLTQRAFGIRLGYPDSRATEVHVGR